MADDPRSLEHAHRMIKELSDHIGRLHKRIEQHERMHNAHARLASEHDARISKLERGRGHAIPQPRVLDHTASSQAEMRKQFRAAVRSGNL